MYITVTELGVRQPVERRQSRTPARIAQIVARAVVRSIPVARVARDGGCAFLEIVPVDGREALQSNGPP